MSEGDRPLLRVVRGTPDDVELAALATVVASLSGRDEEEETARHSAWGDPATLHRGQHQPGPGAWRTSGFPR
jgi:hypothetical protein